MFVSKEKWLSIRVVNRVRCFRESIFDFATTVPLVPAFENFRRIPLGDLIVEGNLGVVEKLRRPGRNTTTVRRVHAAKVFGSTTPFTVAMYEGKDANEEWDKYIAIHSRLRHPNFLQLFGMLTADGLYAAVFHEEYIPFKQALQSYTLTRTHEIYFWNFFERQFHKYANYLLPIAGEAVCPGSDRIQLSNMQFTPWLHRTGIVCFEIAQSNVWSCFQGISKRLEFENVHPAWPQNSYDTALHSAEHLLLPHDLPKMIALMEFCDYYILVGRTVKYRSTRLEHADSVRMSSWLVSDGEKVAREVAFLICPELPSATSYLYGGGCSFRGNDGCCRKVRFFPRNQGVEPDEPDVANLLKLESHSTHEGWLSQAGYVLSQLSLEVDVCSIVRCVDVKMIMHPSKPSVHEAELSLPPLSAFLTPDGTHLQYPTEQPCWFDPVRNEPLSMDKAEMLGLPAIELTIDVTSVYIDKSTLQQLREFHQGKGFDPDSQEIAKHLGYALYYFGNTGDPLPEPRFEMVSTYGADSENGFDSDDSMCSASNMDEDDSFEMVSTYGGESHQHLFTFTDSCLPFTAESENDFDSDDSMCSASNMDEDDSANSPTDMDEDRDMDEVEEILYPQTAAYFVDTQ
ncbi:hypothetical protein R3P38DRAFT_1514587 [Favolaschia claudopus]|uniref:Protein kinase domain-containing protein n=1 Tax=Favolaschia claudopus TaxID=2862362 RepID=A0AAW0AIL5_9AGAR